jgi:hypothetical protein
VRKYILGLLFLALLLLPWILEEAPSEQASISSLTDRVSSVIPSTGPLPGFFLFEEVAAIEQDKADQAAYLEAVRLELERQDAERHQRELDSRNRAPAPIRPAAPPDYSGGDCSGVHWAAREIYMHESGCRVDARNAGGCYGIGQACPGSKLPCGPDFACQHSWFTGYMLGRYGSWEAAASFRRANNWW